AVSRSSTVTSIPRARARQATARPMMPPPTTTSSSCGRSAMRLMLAPQRLPGSIAGLPDFEPMTVIDTGAERRMRLAAARLYLVCPAMTGPGGRDASGLPDLLRGAIAGGGDVVQPRGKEPAHDEPRGLARGRGAL